MKTDAYITAGRIPHIDNSLADFMDTSKSTRDNVRLELVQRLGTVFY